MAEEIVVNIEEGQEKKLAVATTTTTTTTAEENPDSSTTENEDERSTASSNVNADFTKSEKDLLNDLKKRAETFRQAKEEGKQQTKIQRVPTIMKERDGNPKEHYYKPKEIAIGPIHGLNTHLAKTELKRTLAAEFIRASGKTGEYFLSVIKTETEELKKSFDEKVIQDYKDYKSTKMARMLFLDGCSVLQFMHSFVNDELKKLKINNSQATLIQQELFLLENQIPFRVLKLLVMKSGSRRDELVKSIYKFISINVMAPEVYFSQRLESNLKSVRPNEEPVIFQKGKEPVHLLDLLRSELLFGRDDSSQSSRECKQTFRNVQDLKATGIKFKPSKSCSMKAISFSTQCLSTAQLNLPPFVVDNSTAVKLWNLVAYEMSSDEEKSAFGVTSYLSFLDSLIDNEQDVKDLRAVHILRNRLSSDAEVAKLFNTIGSNLVPDKAYSNVKSQIQNHCERKSATWMAQFCQEYIRTPWTILALFAAIIALLLTGFGTWFTVYPRDG